MAYLKLWIYLNPVFYLILIYDGIIN